MSITEKKQRIESEHPLLSIQKQCELIGLARSSYYRCGSEGRESAENLELMEIIDKEYTAHPFYGTRQMRNVLRRKGLFVNRKRIQRLMRKICLDNGVHFSGAKRRLSTPWSGQNLRLIGSLSRAPLDGEPAAHHAARYMVQKIPRIKHFSKVPINGTISA